MAAAGSAMPAKQDIKNFLPIICSAFMSVSDHVCPACWRYGSDRMRAVFAENGKLLHCCINKPDSFA